MILSWFPPLAFTIFIFVALVRRFTILLPYDPFLLKAAVGTVTSVFYFSVVYYLHFRGKGDTRSRIIWFSIIIICFGYLIYYIEIVVEQFHLIEYSILTWLYFLALKRVIKDEVVFFVLFLIVFFIGIVDEWTQFYMPDRVGELWDVSLNGISVGLTIILLSKAFYPGFSSSRISFRSIRIAGFLSICFILSFGVFFVTVTDWGFRHEDPKIGFFYSRFTLDELVEKDRREAKKYAMAINDLFPEKTQKYLRNQRARDKFQVEILAHLFRRDRYEEKGNYRVALKENLILTNYFHESILQSGHGWSPEKLSKIMQKVQVQRNKDYESPVSKGELIVTFGPVAFWGSLFSMIIGFILVMSGRGEKQLMKVGFLKT